MSSENLLFELGNEFIKDFGFKDDVMLVFMGKSLFVSCLSPVLKKSIVLANLKDNPYVGYYINRKVYYNDFNIAGMVFGSGFESDLYNLLDDSVEGISGLVGLFSAKVKEMALSEDSLGKEYGGKYITERINSWLDAKGISVRKAIETS